MSAAAYQAAERQCGPVYSALDSRNPSKALQLVEALLLRSPSALASALRVLALARLPDRPRAHAAVDELLRSAPLPADTHATHALCLALGALGRRVEEAKLLDDAASAQPGNLELGKRALLALVRAAQWQRASQVSLRMSKAASAAVAALPTSVRSQMQSEADSLLWGAVCAFLLLSRTPEATGAKLALPLAQRMAASQLAARPLGSRSDEEAWLAATVNARIAASKSGEEQQKGLLAALEVLQGGEGNKLVARNLGLQELRRSLRKQVGQWEEVRHEAKTALKAGERNWSLVEALVEASIELARAGKSEALKEAANEIEALGGGARDRTARLAITHLRGKALEAQLASHLVANEEALAEQLVQDVEAYLVDLGDLACVADDLDSYVRLLPSAQRASLAEEWKAPLPATLADTKALYASLNRAKLARLASLPSTSALQELALATTYVTSYAAALPLGVSLPETEMQPADDFVLLATHALLSSPITALALLAYALKKSPKGYRLRIVRARLLARLGATSLARQEAGRVGIKGVQWDTLGWIAMERTAHTAIGDAGTERRLVREVKEIYEENARELPKLISKAFEHGTYSRVEEFVDFSEELDRSIARQLVRVDSARSVLLLGASASQVQGLKEVVHAVRDALKQGIFDNRDLNVLPTLLPFGSTSVEEQLSLGSGKRPGIKYVRAMLDVLSVALGVDVDSAVESGEQNDELTKPEVELHALALALTHADAQVDEAQITSFFERRLEEVRTTAADDTARPWHVLHSAATSLEGYLLLQSVAARQPNLKQLVDKTRSSLDTLAGAVEAYKPTIDVSEEEEKTLLPLVGSAEEVRALLRVAREDVETDRKVVFAALVTRLREL